MAFHKTIDSFMQSGHPGVELPSRVPMAEATKKKYRDMFPGLKIVVRRDRTYLVNTNLLT